MTSKNLWSFDGMVLLFSKSLSSVVVWSSCNNLNVSFLYQIRILRQGLKFWWFCLQPFWNTDKHLIKYNLITPIKAYGCLWYCCTTFLTMVTRLRLIFRYKTWNIHELVTKKGPETSFHLMSVGKWMSWKLYHKVPYIRRLLWLLLKPFGIKCHKGATLILVKFLACFKCLNTIKIQSTFDWWVYFPQLILVSL